MVQTPRGAPEAASADCCREWPGLEGDRQGQAVRDREENNLKKRRKKEDERKKRRKRLQVGPRVRKSCNLPNNTNLLPKITQ
jgi:hypothetical protein